MLWKVLKERELGPEQRLCRELEGRTITIFRHGDSIFAIDSLCYHMGGPLGAEGDIEDLGGQLTIRCPWHGHRVDLSSGHAVTVAEQPRNCDEGASGPSPCPSVTHVTDSKRQRIHRVIRDDGYIWVDVIDGVPPVPSDKYNSMRAATGWGLAGPGSPLRPPGSSTYVATPPSGPPKLGLDTHLQASQQPGPESTIHLSQPLLPYAGVSRVAPAPSPISIFSPIKIAAGLASDTAAQPPIARPSAAQRQLFGAASAPSTSGSTAVAMDLGLTGGPSSGDLNLSAANPFGGPAAAHAFTLGQSGPGLHHGASRGHQLHHGHFSHAHGGHHGHHEHAMLQPKNLRHKAAVEAIHRSSRAVPVEPHATGQKRSARDAHLASPSKILDGLPHHQPQQLRQSSLLSFVGRAAGGGLGARFEGVGGDEAMES